MCLVLKIIFNLQQDLTKYNLLPVNSKVISLLLFLFYLFKCRFIQIFSQYTQLIGKFYRFLPGATGDCGDEAGLGIGAEEKGSSGGPLKAVAI